MNALNNLVALLLAGLLAGCSSQPPLPGWQLQAKDASERFVNAYLSGQRSAAAEFARAKADVSSTGRIDLLARLELLRCAAEVAALVVQSCPGFEVLRQDAPPAERAYADYLAGLNTADAALLPPAQRRVAEQGAAALAGVKDALARLVAAGALLRSGRASPDTLDQAVVTASAQGWRRALLAWLGAQALRAEQAGDMAQAGRIKRRIALVEGGIAPPQAAP